MPLRDHFHPPVLDRLCWETLHAGWVAALTVHLNRRWLVGDEFVALEETRAGGVLKIDIGTYEEPVSESNGTVATMTATWAPPTALASTLSTLPGFHEVRVMRQRGGRHLVAAIELVSPSNEESPAARAGFVAKCVTYLQAGVCVVIIDLVTECHFNLHNDLVTALHAPDESRLPPPCTLYAAAYRPVLREGRPEVDIWAAECILGQELPTMPLRLTGDLFVPVEFETTYEQVCSDRKLR